jgi:hypothetical protein
MAGLLVTVHRGENKHELGSFQELEFLRNHMREPGAAEPIVSHVHHRWTVPGAEHSYTHLEVVGPLWILGPDAQKVGPYLSFSVVNGTAYVDQRIFAFLDVQQDDWYITDLGEHWKTFRVRFHSRP